jgi:uncharacterized protein (TIGR03083 family)
MTASNKGVDHSDADHAPEVDQLARAFAAVDDLVAGIRPEQWSARTPCSEWTVRQLIAHLIGMNRVFIALLDDEPMPRPVDLCALRLPGFRIQPLGDHEVAKQMIHCVEGVGDAFKATPAEFTDPPSAYSWRNLRG